MPSRVHENPLIIRPDSQLLERHPGLQHASNVLMLKYRAKQLVTDEELQALGQYLWQVLEIENDFEQAKEKAGTAILPIIIESDQAAIQQLPWEILHSPEIGFLGKSRTCTLSRRIAKTESVPAPLEPGPLRVLLFTSLPDDLDAEKGRLNVEEEQAQVQEALMPWIAKGLVELEMPDDGRFSTLQEQLKTFQPHLVFLSGHGHFHHQPHTGEAPYSTFLFESEIGSSEPIPEGKIAEAFIGSAVNCVVLSACESGKASSDFLNNGLMRNLSQRGIAHVIGMRESILDRAGILFARAFCDAIARQERIDVALQAAREVITTPLKESTWKDSEITGLSELSLGQWCLPSLISPEASQPLIDWNFSPQVPTGKLNNQSLKSITLPPRFLGRRSELRQLKSDLQRGKRQQLLIIGPGGQGKTALAGKLAHDCQQRGYEILACSVRSEDNWQEFLFELELQLNPANVERYNRMIEAAKDETSKAKLLLRLLLQQSENRIVLFLDNLESLQNPDTLALESPVITAWIKAAQTLLDQGLLLLLTSRWQLPNWPDADLWNLKHASYGDFLQMARQQRLPSKFFQEPNRLHRVYQTLHGNGRGLEFFIAAIEQMNSNEEAAFLEKLAQAEAEVQTDMALAKIVEHLSDQEQELLERLPAYHTAVPLEGVIKLALDMEQPVESLLAHLCNVSLVEKYHDPHWQADQYQCSPLVVSWLIKKGKVSLNHGLLYASAEYQHYLFDWERKTLEQAIIVHQAWRTAGEKETADRFALDTIIAPLNLRGLYQTLLQEWLPDICQSDNQQIQADALNQTGKQRYHLGEYGVALEYYQQSLTISKKIGDKAGEGTTLNNISQIFGARGDYDQALNYLQQSLVIQQEIGDKAREGTTLNNISQIFDARGDYDQALNYLKQSLVIQQEIEDKAGEGTTLNNISQIFQARGNYNQALNYLQQSLAIIQEIGDKASEGGVLNNISTIFQARGDYDQALNYLKQSLAITQEIGDKAREGSVLNNISQIFQARGDYQGALDYLQQSLAIMKEIGDKAGEGTTLNNISTIFQARGDYDQALNYFQQSLAIQQEIGNKAEEGTTLNNISTIFQARGDYDQALHYLQQSLAIMKEIGDKAGEGTTLNNIAAIFKARGDYDQTLEYLQQSLAIMKEIGDKAGEGTTLNNISQIFQAHGDYDQALQYLQQSLAIQQEIGDLAGLCATLFNIGHIHAGNEDWSQAVGCWLEVYRIANKIQLQYVLDALEKLAGQLGLSGGLAGWEQLAEKMERE